MRYEYDDSGRLLCALGDGILPRFVLGRSAEGCVWRFAADLEPDLVRVIARLAARESGFPIASEIPESPPERLAMIERLLVPEASDSATGYEILIQNGVSIAELWTIP